MKLFKVLEKEKAGRDSGFFSKRKGHYRQLQCETLHTLQLN